MPCRPSRYAVTPCLSAELAWAPFIKPRLPIAADTRITNASVPAMNRVRRRLRDALVPEGVDGDAGVTTFMACSGGGASITRVRRLPELRVGIIATAACSARENSRVDA